MSDAKHLAVGKFGEDIAVKFLEQNGYKIICRNLRVSRKEIDIIAEDDCFLVFFEVKTRSYFPESNDFGTPGYAVDSQKRMFTVKAAEAYLRNNPTDKQPRIDVIEVVLKPSEGNSLHTQVLSVNHIRNAFDSRGRKH